MKKVVLDKFGSAWGEVEVEKEETKIRVATGGRTADGAPIAVQDRKVSSNKKYFKELERCGNFTVFTAHKYAGCYSDIYYYTA